MTTPAANQNSLTAANRRAKSGVGIQTTVALNNRAAADMGVFDQRGLPGSSSRRPDVEEPRPSYARPLTPGSADSNSPGAVPEDED